MGTRSITVIRDEDKQILATIYKQYDGYPESWGKDLLDFTTSKTMVNGMGRDRNIFNGIEDFTAQLIAEFKDGPGNLYLYPPIKPKAKGYRKYWDYCWADYAYEIDHELNVTCHDCYRDKPVSLTHENTREINE